MCMDIFLECGEPLVRRWLKNTPRNFNEHITSFVLYTFAWCSPLRTDPSKRMVRSACMQFYLNVLNPFFEKRNIEQWMHLSCITTDQQPPSHLYKCLLSHSVVISLWCILLHFFLTASFILFLWLIQKEPCDLPGIIEHHSMYYTLNSHLWKKS